MADRTEAALGSVQERILSLQNLWKSLIGATFEQGQPRFLRWAEQTEVQLARAVSPSEAQRFRDVWQMHTFESLEQYFGHFNSELDALYQAISEAPESFFQTNEKTAALQNKSFSPAGADPEENQLAKIQNRFLGKKSIGWIAFVFSILIVILTFGNSALNFVKNWKELSPSVKSADQPANEAPSIYQVYVKQQGGQPIAGVKVSIQGASALVPEFTDSEGMVRFELKPPLPKELKLIADATGYVRYDQNLETKFKSGETLTQEIRLNLQDQLRSRSPQLQTPISEHPVIAIAGCKTSFDQVAGKVSFVITLRNFSEFAVNATLTRTLYWEGVEIGKTGPVVQLVAPHEVLTLPNFARFNVPPEADFLKDTTRMRAHFVAEYPDRNGKSRVSADLWYRPDNCEFAQSSEQI